MIRLTITGLIALLAISSASLAQENATKYVRYSQGGTVAYGILRGQVITRLDGELFSSRTETNETVSLSAVRLLPPCEPSKVIAVGLNYRSHLGDRTPAEYPGLFAKYPTSIVGHEDEIIVPPDAKNLHYEGELVIVIGKRAKAVAVEVASDYVFGVTAGNDISERDWQRDDLQWLRAKASDTFGPIGPAIVSGLDYNDLLVETRVNGETKQSERTRDLIFDVETIVSYVSQYVTLLPGDLIFTGTPGSTEALKAGDVVEVEVEGVGVLRNIVAKAR